MSKKAAESHKHAAAHAEHTIHVRKGHAEEHGNK